MVRTPRLGQPQRGVDYDDAIYRAISACRVVVVVLTDEALESEWVKTEIAQAPEQAQN